jgi:RNA polymerase sigma-70 factor (ECF subfamily)
MITFGKDRLQPAYADRAAETGVGLSEIDRNLLERCIQRKPRAWEDFVDRFLGLVLHVINHTAQARSVRLSAEDRDDLCAEVFLTIIQDDFGLLRHFRGQSSLATYLTVVARRIVVRKMLQQKGAARLNEGVASASREVPDRAPPAEDRILNAEEIERLLEGLDATEAKIVRMYHLQGNSYQEISTAVGMPENSIGPILSRARSKMRESRVSE